MSKESLPQRQESSAESPEALEKRRRSWGRFRNFALSASLLVSGGFVGDKVVNNYQLEKLEHSLDSGKGSTFSIDNKKSGEKGDFRVYDRSDGEYVIEGNFQRDGKDVQVLFHLPRHDGVISEIRDLEQSKTPVETLRKMIDTASYGEVKTHDPETGITYASEFGDAKGRADMQSQETVTDKEGKVISSAKNTLGDVAGIELPGYDLRK